MISYLTTREKNVIMILCDIIYFKGGMANANSDSVLRPAAYADTALFL